MTRFDVEHHPEFSAARDGSGQQSARIKFNHARHLAKGLTLQAGGSAFTFADLDALDRTRYGWTPGQALTSPVELECATCHQLDGEEYARGLQASVASRVPPRNLGATMLPVTYENHCRACHPLTFDSKLPRQQMRHGLSTSEIVDSLRGIYAADAITRDPALLRRFVPPRRGRASRCRATVSSLRQPLLIRSSPRSSFSLDRRSTRPLENESNFRWDGAAASSATSSKPLCPIFKLPATRHRSRSSQF